MSTPLPSDENSNKAVQLWSKFGGGQGIKEGMQATSPENPDILFFFFRLFDLLFFDGSIFRNLRKFGRERGPSANQRQTYSFKVHTYEGEGWEEDSLGDTKLRLDNLYQVADAARAEIHLHMLSESIKPKKRLRPYIGTILHEQIHA
jgi:hypothetical protein